MDPARAGRRRRWTLPLAGFLVLAAAAVLAVGFLYPELNPFQKTQPAQVAEAKNPPQVDGPPKGPPEPAPKQNRSEPESPEPKPAEPKPQPKAEPEPKSTPPEPQPESPPLEPKPQPQPNPQPKPEPKEDVVTLVAQLKDMDPLVRLRAARQLATLGPAAKLAIPALKEAAENDADEVVRIAARRALQAAVDTQSKETLATLLQQLQDKNPLVRLQAATRLGKLGASAKSALPALKQALTDSDEDVRLVARRSVEAIEQALAQEVKPILEQIQKDLKSKKIEDRLAGVESLRRLGEEGKALTALLLQSMLETSGHTEKFLDALEKVHPALHRPILTLIVDRSARNHVNALQQIALLGPDGGGALPFLQFIYRRSLTSKSGSGSSDLGPASSGDYCVGSLYAMANVAPENNATIQAIVGALVAPSQRVYYVDEILNEMETITIGTARFRIDNSSRLYALHFANSLKIDRKLLVNPMISWLSDPEHGYVAIHQLGEIGPDAKAAIPLLNKLRFASTEAVRDAAVKALEKIQK